MKTAFLFVCALILIVYLIKKFSDFRRCNGYNRILKNEYEKIKMNKKQKNSTKNS